MSRAEKFHQTYPENTNKRDQIHAILFKKRVRHLLAVAKHTLDALGIPFWISSGTCLGMYYHVQWHKGWKTNVTVCCFYTVRPKPQC